MGYFSTRPAAIAAIISITALGLGIPAMAIALATGLVWPFFSGRKRVIAFDVDGVMTEGDYYTERLRERKGMKNIVSSLRKNYRVVSVSNDNTIASRAISREIGLKPFFDAEFVSSEIGVKKPDKGVFNFLLKRFGIGPGEMIFIDDKPENVESAKRLGITGFHFTCPEKLVADLRRANISI